MAGREADDTYSDALRREIMRSEQQRMRVIVIILAMVLVAVMLVLNFIPQIDERLFDKKVPGWVPLAGIGPYLLYELAALSLLRWRSAKGKDFPRIARFGNALIETSLPASITYVLSGYMQPQLVFAFWPPLLFFVFILLSTLRLDFWLSVWTGTVAAALQMVLVLVLLPVDPTAAADNMPLFYIGRSMVLFGSGVVAGLVAVSLRRQFENSILAGAARDRVTNLFGQHVSPSVVERLLATQTEPPSELRTICVLFLDIRGFTAMTRQRPAAETVELLNAFFAEMIDVVDRHHGIINKFLGDGFLALFGAPLADPSAAQNALGAARAMIEAVEAWNKERPSQALRVGIGIHMGEAVTGVVGSPRRKEYTVIGDTVNLAARLEQLTKETGSQVLVSNSVHAAVAADGAVDLGPLAIRGYDEKVQVWQVM
ncbi:adenylate/guanylate cyclase domain-containing protein [Reyranella massiliensis]|uniref:adenylate/guanylate cyclase domain-containing protein n=1 Tax=Reyranella massiliensis TaxID=445220 RepID=UPI0002D8E2B6|nr:adenylate/guanylate cyclase domain-containing protein [Reyranella massiliensis]